MLGKLTIDAVPYHEPIIMVALGGGGLLGLLIAAAITKYKLWGYLWKEWFTSVDHKRIGVMYIIVALVMLLRGFADAAMMRTQQALVGNGGEGVFPPHHYDQIFTAHGVIMIFFMAMPFMTGLLNLIVPLQIGARDVAFPFLNSLSFWLFVAGAALINISLGVGEFAQTGWLAYPPLSGLEYSPGVGVDYYIWALQISGLGTLLTGVNFFVTILRMRAPGMTLMRMPVFTWTALITNILIIAAFPILTVALALLGADRYLGTHFFTNGGGGNAMMYVNLIWIWGHPEVYILILPAFGIFSELIATYSRKRLFGYTSMVYATSCIGVLSFVVWLHHFFTMGSGANVNAFFGITTMIISIPTGVKIFNWLFTMFRGRVHVTAPVLWTIGFIITFSIGGMTGVMLAIPAVDFVLHNSLFLIAHFHNVIIGGVVFGYLAGLTYWFPKAFGFQAQRKAGQGLVLVLDHRFLCGLHAAVRARLHGHDPPHEHLQPSRVGAVAVCGCGGCCDHRHGYLPEPAADRLQRVEAQGPHGLHRRPVGWPYAGMGDFVAASVLQLRRAAAHRRPRPVLGRQAERQGLGASFEVRSHPHAAQHRCRRLHRCLQRADGLRSDLAHLVAGHHRPGGHDRQLHCAYVR